MAAAYHCRKFGATAAMFATLFLLGADTSAQVNQFLGNLAPGQSVRILYEVTINTPLTVAVTQISHQGAVSGLNFTTVNTDDPETGTANDATVTLLAQDFDFGDAPDPTYPTLLASSGARHFIPAGGATLYLGAVAPDAEADGQPNSTATGDNVAGTDDEGGVSLPNAFRGGLASNITVNVTGSGGLLNAWIDWNRDGDWNDAGEQIATNRAVSAGANVIAVLAPSVATASGGSFARFRLSTQSGLLPTGQANDGEVEDYAATLQSNTPPVAVNDTLGTRQNRAVSMAAFKLLSNDTDADGDVLSVIGVTATSTNGGSVVLASGTITYTPLAALTNADRFTYTNSDGRGGVATGLVLIAITSSNLVSGNVVFGPVIQGAEFVVRFAGIPGTNYTIEAADNLTPPVPWTKKVNKVAPADNMAGFGIGVFEYRENTLGAPQRFYRTVYPAY